MDVTEYPIVKLRKGREGSLRRRHPWVFSGALLAKPKLESGAPVWVADESGEVLATAFYFDSSIALKVVSFSRVRVGAALVQARVTAAWQRRNRLELPNERTTGFRLVHGEADELPGVIIDIYGDAAVLQFQIAPWEPLSENFCAALLSLDGLKLRTVYRKDDGPDGVWLKGDGGIGTFREDGLEYSVDWVNGQKTGFFLDQRENRALVRRYAHRRSVLNVFSYTGGFSLAALAGGALEAVSLDSSERALELAEQNVRKNFPNATHESVRADAFKALETVTDRFNLIVLDPPAFAKHRDAVSRAAKGYEAINMLALTALKPGGLLFTFSCSQLIDRELFKKILFQASLSAGRHVQIVHELHQAPCHPVSVFHPEGEYLKGFVLSVD